MSDKLIIKAKLRDYQVDFSEDFSSALKEDSLANNFFVIDEKVFSLYKERIGSAIVSGSVFKVKANEFNKTIDYSQSLIKELIKKNIRKDSTIIAIGGGIIQDIAAFISSILFRGVRWVFYPTTLLAQSDSCIGSKSSINFGEYKNLIGTFYPPGRVTIDMGFLETLSIDDIKSGIGEMLHYYFIFGSEDAKKLEAGYEKLFSCRKLFKSLILSSLKIKKGFIEIDEFDKNERNLLNYGHTFGHALESVSNYSLNHGQAVTMGMDMANFISMNLGILSREDFQLMHEILLKNMPEYRIKKNDFKEYFIALGKDKKNIGKDIGCILTKGPGSMIKMRMPLDERLKGLIAEYNNRRLNLKR